MTRHNPAPPTLATVLRAVLPHLSAAVTHGRVACYTAPDFGASRVLLDAVIGHDYVTVCQQAEAITYVGDHNSTMCLAATLVCADGTWARFDREWAPYPDEGAWSEGWTIYRAPSHDALAAPLLQFLQGGSAAPSTVPAPTGTRTRGR